MNGRGPGQDAPWPRALGVDDDVPELSAHDGAGRFAWALTGSGHMLEESLELAARLPHVDLFLSAAAEEVLPRYGIPIDSLRERFRVFRDKTASAVPVGELYEAFYHTLVVAPATSNTWRSAI